MFAAKTFRPTISPKRRIPKAMAHGQWRKRIHARPSHRPFSLFLASELLGVPLQLGSGDSKDEYRDCRE
eukprot:CAMPEP_0170189676 /NCGR_PEP_ID=MMETSP0040_2-20121228/47419_1 /TAXON_ID=641309 /ORGANISM="Lotharella oceanica, Strain CCMP622" /LENGTH=68 /DNA_ID=CAMNT_0010437311 /DNA_START=1176 /DNA_END=1379 /DNA_ORIENTATION=-